MTGDLLQVDKCIAPIHGMQHNSIETLSQECGIVIYGGGKTSREVLEYLKVCGHKICAVLDRGVTPDSFFADIPLLTLEDWCGSYNTEFFHVVVAIHNRDTELTAIYDRVVSLDEFVNICPDCQPFSDWLSN